MAITEIDGRVGLSDSEELSLMASLPTMNDLFHKHGTEGAPASGNQKLSAPRYLVGSILAVLLSFWAMAYGAMAHWTTSFYFIIPVLCCLPWIALWRGRCRKRANATGGGRAGKTLVIASLVVPLLAALLFVILIFITPHGQQLGEVILGFLLAFASHSLGLLLLAIGVGVQVWQDHWHKWLTTAAIAYHAVIFFLYIWSMTGL
jgi:hypothetical protein